MNQDKIDEEINYDAVEFFFISANQRRLFQYLYHCPECRNLLGDENQICNKCGSTVNGELL